MKRVSLLAGLSLLIATAANATGPSVNGFRFEGYMDQAPAGAVVVNEVKVGSQADARTLHIVRIERMLPIHDCESCGLIDDSIALENRNLQLRAEGEGLEALLSAKKGERVSGHVVQANRAGALVLNGLDGADTGVASR